MTDTRTPRDLVGQPRTLIGPRQPGAMTREQALALMREIVEDQASVSRGGPATLDPTLGYVSNAVYCADLVMRTAQQLPADDPDAQHWIRSAIDEIRFRVSELPDNWSAAR